MIYRSNSMARFKKQLLASVTILLSTTLTFLFLNLCANIFAMQLFGEEQFPRGWHKYVGRFYRTLYVQAHDGILEEWTAILGDSYAEGAGDAYLAGEKKYNLAHFLRDERPENFLIFGRSGFGSMRAVREFLIANEEFSEAWFLPDIDTPNRIIFLFYEGNDLTDNLRHLKSQEYDNGDLHSFVTDEIARPTDYRRRLDYYLPLLRPVYLQTKSIILSTLNHSTEENRTPNSELGKDDENVNSFQSPADEDAHQTIVVSEKLESAAMELSRKELDLGIAVFRESTEFVAAKYPTGTIAIVYIPSPVTLYEWNDPVRIKTWLHENRNSTTKRENDQRSDYIRNRIASIAADNKIQFIDPTDKLRTETDVQILHGPVDWNHLNSEGYSLLSIIVDERRN